MVRKALSEGPSLFCEWAVGSTVNSAVRKLRKERLEREREEAKNERGVIKVEVMTDDESETESVRVTYPRNGSKGGAKGAAKASSGPKKVRFENGTLKPALRQKDGRRGRAHASSGSDTLVSESDSGTDTRSVTAVNGHPSSEESSSDMGPSRRRKLCKSSRARSMSSSDSDDGYDSICSDCGDDLAKKRAKARRSRKYVSDPESSTGSEKVRRRSKEEKRKLLKKKQSSQRSGSHKSALVEVDFASDTESKKVSSRSKKHGSRHHSKDASSKGKESKSSISPDQKPYPEAMPGPHVRRPNLIRPIRAEVMQVEHTVEGPEDPRPNAFVDEHNNIVRVYHGPAFGNPFGKLYPRRNTSLQPLPIGVPHPLGNPYYHGFGSPQQQGHSQSPMGHIPTTMGVSYPSVPAGVGPRPYTHMTTEQADLRDGLWGIGPGADTTGTKEKPSSWNNVGPPKPSASLREANPTSRWGFGSSKKGGVGDFSGASQKMGGDGNASGGWDNTGNQDHNAGGNEGVKWDSGAGNKSEDNTAGDDNTGNTGQNWGPSNEESGKNEAWKSTGNQGGSWSRDKSKSGNGWDAGNNPSGAPWDSNGNNNDSTWKDNNNDNNDNNEDANYGATGGSWNATANDSTWKTDANDNTSAKSASNNVGFSRGSDAGSPPSGPPGQPQGDNVFGQDRNHVPGSWEETSPAGGGGGGFGDWRDTTAAQSTTNW